MWEIRVEKTDRLDRLLRSIRHTGAEWLSRQAWEQLLADGFIQVDGRIQTKGGANVMAGAELRVRFPGPELGLLVASEPARLVWQSPEADWGIFFKNPGLATYPLMPWERDSFANQVAAYVTKNGPISLPAFVALADPPRLEGGLLQRLDRDTSGLVSVAFTSSAKASFRKQFTEGQIEKSYLAIVRGDASSITGSHELFLHAPKGGKTLVSQKSGEPVAFRVRTMLANERASLVEFSTNRGIRHIVRASMAALGYALVGDSTYGDGVDAEFHQLHAHRLRSLNGDAAFPSGLEALPPQSFLDSLTRLGLH
jgi:23S rRNA pseudouridine1911/1915/1917 synthase